MYISENKMSHFHKKFMETCKLALRIIPHFVHRNKKKCPTNNHLLYAISVKNERDTTVQEKTLVFTTFFFFSKRNCI